MPKLPWFKFFPSAWCADANLQRCSLTTRGFWVELLCAMHQLGRSGVLSGQAEQIARLTRCSTADVIEALTELQNTGAAEVTFRNNTYTVVNRRMKREAKERSDSAKRQERFREKGGGDPDRWTYIRARILMMDEKKCAYCGRKATTVDHVIPRTKGGDESDSNLVACCKICNSTKNNRTPSEAKMSFHSSFTRLSNSDIYGSNGNINAKLTLEKLEVRSKKLENTESTGGAPDLSTSNLFRSPVRPTIDQVVEAFVLRGGTKDQAQKFFDKHEATDWFLNNSPIRQFAALIPGYLSAWKEREGNNGTNEIKMVF